MRVRTNVKAGGRNLNHNEKLVGDRAAIRRLKVQTNAAAVDDLRNVVGRAETRSKTHAVLWRPRRSPAGLSATSVPDQLWHQNVANVEDTAEAADSFGISLAAGDFNSDARDDLAVGVPACRCAEVQARPHGVRS